jgi:hypothetical protein
MQSIQQKDWIEQQAREKQEKFDAIKLSEQY